MNVASNVNENRFCLRSCIVLKSDIKMIRRTEMEQKNLSITLSPNSMSEPSYRLQCEQELFKLPDILNVLKLRRTKYV